MNNPSFERSYRKMQRETRLRLAARMDAYALLAGRPATFTRIFASEADAADFTRYVREALESIRERNSNPEESPAI